ncbi:MAG: adenosine-specific kinase [Deltaproteobacteria bacterium]|nr:adenosine-specific kinase [Deltaproteobacteria bacterium]
MELINVKLEIPDGVNLVLGQSHFIKTAEDLYEVMVTSVPGAKFGLAFAEASGPCLVRSDGNDTELVALAVKQLLAIGAGHSFLLLMREAYPINVLNAIKSCPEVCRIFCATANPLQVVVAQSEQGRGILGVIDGSSPTGVESEDDKRARRDFLRQIGYKR